ncbi:hypothetical protein CYJ73_18505 [Gordonia terrae]|uniref:Uncharacterized protein n=1 Tax=Gordonia terrae TaxID=2055 RepID=A0A2I1R4R6_9ACTN|nr:hypothetical protein CYJ73_18505 [Gordonia terrae]
MCAQRGVDLQLVGTVLGTVLVCDAVSGLGAERRRQDLSSRARHITMQSLYLDGGATLRP